MSLNLFVLTGAGISAESGLGTFRYAGGLWTTVNLAEVATPEGYERNPQKVLEFYNARRRALLEARPNAAHVALARLEAALTACGGSLWLCTQNIDDLHEQAGSQSVWHMHGELKKARCGGCEVVVPWPGDIHLSDGCLSCGRVGEMRPHVVWFGEMPLGLEQIAEALENAAAFVSIGTSGAVYPAAGFVSEARALGIRTVELNLEPSDNAFVFDETRYGPASVVVPAWVEHAIGRLSGQRFST